jgi:type IV pilus assembly protein PilM
MRLKKRNVSIGLDIGSQVLKVVVLSNSGSRSSRPKLENYAIQDVGKGGQIPSDADTSALLKRVFSEARIDGRDVHSAVSGNSVVVRYVNLRKMSPESLGLSMKREASQHIPFDVKDVEMDFSILDDMVPSEPNTMRVLLAAAKKDECTRLTKLIRSAGLNPTAIDVDSIALVNSYVYSDGRESEKTPVALVNIGAKKTSVDIVDNKKPAFTRNVEIGGEGMTVAIARGMSIELEEAERMKVFGDAIVHEHLKMVLDSIVRQLRTSFDYYEGLSGKDVAKVYLSGGGAMLNGFVEFLSENLALQVDIWDPLTGIDTTEFESDERLKTIRPTLDVAVGLALRGD